MHIKLISIWKCFLLLLEITESIHLMKSRTKLACYVIRCEMEEFFPLPEKLSLSKAMRFLAW